MYLSASPCTSLRIRFVLHKYHFAFICELVKCIFLLHFYPHVFLSVCSLQNPPTSPSLPPPPLSTIILFLLYTVFPLQYFSFSFLISRSCCQFDLYHITMTFVTSISSKVDTGFTNYIID